MVIARAADEKINVGFPSEMERRGLALGSFGARNIARRQKRAPRKSNLTLKVPGWSGSDGRIPREKGEKPVRQASSPCRRRSRTREYSRESASRFAPCHRRARCFSFYCKVTRFARETLARRFNSKSGEIAPLPLFTARVYN